MWACMCPRERQRVSQSFRLYLGWQLSYELKEGDKIGKKKGNIIKINIWWKQFVCLSLNFYEATSLSCG